MDEQRVWMKSRRKKRLRMVAVMLCFCLLITADPNMPGTMSVAAAESTNPEAIGTVKQAMFDRITTLPELGEYLATEPDMDEDEESYAQWEEKLYEYAEEAHDIWKEYEALTEEQQARISKEELTKLTAWVELAETFSQTGMTLAAETHTHSGSGSGIAFTMWNNASSLPTQAGNWCLSTNVTLTSAYQIPGDVKLCLNGHTISGSVSKGMIRVYGGTLNIYDCSSSKSGKIICPDGNNPIQVSENGVLNLYGGTVQSGTASAIPIGTGSTDSSGGTVNVYNGATIIGGTNGILVNKNLSSSHVNIYGGSISGGGSGSPVKMQNPNGSVTIHGDAEISPQPSIYTVTPVVSNTQVSNTYTIDYANVGERDTVVSGSTDTVHYKLNSSSYVLVPYGGNLIAAESEYTVALNPNGGSGGTGLTSYTTGQGAVLPTDWKKTNYVFEGWYEKADLSGTKVERISNTDFGDKTYYAKWTPVSYTITYDLDGGTVTGNPTSYTMESSAITLKNPTRTGYTFAGWSGTGLTGSSNTSVTISTGSTGNRSYTAHWTANTYTVTYNKNSGSITNESSYTSYTYGTGLTLPMPTRTGYTFGGWYTSSGFSGTAVTKITTTDTGNKTYYAKWTAATYTITYNKNSGSITNESNYTSYTYGTGLTLPTPKRTGYTFDGWYTSSDLTGTAVTKITTTDTGNKTYYAKWTANAYTVTYNKNSGSITNESSYTSYTYGSGLTLPTPKRTGYTFDGWYTSSGFSGTAVTKITTTDTGNKTYYAKWTANTYTVTFDYQDATGGNSEKTRTVTYDSAYGIVSDTSKSLPSPTRTGYTFKGWYTQAGGKGNKITDTTTVNITAAQTLYAYWKDETAPNAPTLQAGVTLPAGWTNTQDAIPLKLYDSVAVTELWVSVDGGTYTKVMGFPSGSTEYSYAVTEGEHTYCFKARDAAGNESAERVVYKVMLDKSKPVIGTLTYENKAKDISDWTIGKKSLLIKVPVTDEGSGVTQISFCMTPTGTGGVTGATQSGTAKVKNDEAEITFAQDFKGTITITCTDKVGNTADSVTIGVSGGGVIVEDTAPEIIVLADRGTSDTSSTQENGVALSGGYYETAPAIIVTVLDDMEGAIATGVEAMTYQVEGAAKKNVSVEANVLQEQVIFTIPASEIPTGVTVIRITATDNAGNEASKSITVKVKGPEKTPAAAIDYDAEKLKDLVPQAEYSINETSYTADEKGCIPIDESWFDTTVSIVKRGNSIETLDSSAQSLPIPARPDAPDAPVLESRTDGSVILQTIPGAQYRIADEDWQDSMAFTGLDEKTIYSFTARYSAKENSFASLPGSKAQIATMPKPPTADELTVNYVEETFAPQNGVEAFAEEGCTTGVSAGDVTAYVGQTIYIRYSAKGIIPESLTTAVQIPARPDRPNAGSTDATYPNAEDGTITGLAEGTAYEIRVKGADGSFGAWKAAELNGTKIENLPAGEYEVRVKAVENVSFRSEEAAVTIGEMPSTQYETPDIQINYINENLTGFVPDAQYSIKYTGEDGRKQTMDIAAAQDGVLVLKEDWLGTTFTIVRKGNGKDKTDSEAQSLPIPQRPQKPTPVGVDVSTFGGTGKLTGLTADASYEISADDGKTWESKTTNKSGEITGLAPGSYRVRVKAGTSNFAGLPSDSVCVDDYKVTVTFVANGENYKTFSVYYGGELKEIPTVPEKKDAGDRTYTGAWCSDQQGTPVDFTNITTDMIVYAVYTAYYTVTLEGGTGYTLTAVSGSTSPVLEGGSFTFQFALADGYEKSGSFAVKVNGKAVKLTADDTYTITDIMGDKTVTVEGIEKIPVYYTVTMEGGTGYTLTAASGSTSPVLEGGSFTFQFALKKGYQKTKTFAVMVNGGKVELTAGQNYTITDIKENKTVTVNGVKKKTSSGNSGGSHKDSDEDSDGNPPTDSNPSAGSNPPTGGNPPAGSSPSTGGNPPAGSSPSTGGNPPAGSSPSTGGNPPTDGKPSTGSNAPDGNQPTGSNLPDGEEIQVVPVIIEGGSIIISGEPEAIAESGPVMTDSANGMTAVSAILQTGGGSAAGAVIVTVVCEDKKYAAGVMDTAAVANAVLTPGQMRLVSDGETIEVRIDVKDISETVAGQDKEVIENALGVYREELPGLTLGMYIDISLFIRAGEGDWDAVTSTKEPIEVVIGIPEELKADGREFYIIRAHEGEYTILADLDNDPNTLTISTDRFSSYAIVYEETDGVNGNHKCGLCHTCPTFLGVCCFIWLIAGVAILLVSMIIVLRRKKYEVRR